MLVREVWRMGGGVGGGKPEPSPPSPAVLLLYVPPSHPKERLCLLARYLLSLRAGPVTGTGPVAACTHTALLPGGVHIHRYIQCRVRCYLFYILYRPRCAAARMLTACSHSLILVSPSRLTQACEQERRKEQTIFPARLRILPSHTHTPTLTKYLFPPSLSLSFSLAIYPGLSL